MVGLEINSDNLLKAARKVDKVDIGYATISTKVNVRKLKSDIWDHIHKTIRSRPTPSVDTENAAPPSAASATPPPARGGAKAGKAEKDSNIKDSISFRGLIGNVSQKQEQSSVTLPFYFICLLHLANEKVCLSSYKIIIIDW
jgi:condensin complex subunit 2